MFDWLGIYDWVSSISRGVIIAMIELYLEDKAEREVLVYYINIFEPI